MILFAFHKDNTALKVYIDNDDFVIVGMPHHGKIYATIWQNNMPYKDQLAIRLSDKGYNIKDFIIV